MPLPTTVVIADDAPIVVYGLRALLDSKGAGKVKVLDAVIGELPRRAADVLLLGGKAGTGSTEAALDLAVRSGLYRSVVVMAWRAPSERAKRFIDQGARGVLCKSADAATLVGHIVEAASGEIVTAEFPAQEWRELPLPDGGRLSARERELLTLLASGLTNLEIGKVMFIAESSVKTYIKRIYRKLGATNRATATLRAVEIGVVAPDGDTPGPG